MFKAIGAIILIARCGCLTAQQVINPQVIAWLDTGYAFGTTDTARSEAIWNGGKGRQDLINIVKDTSLNFIYRFLASDILFERDRNYPAGVDKKMLGRLYAEAMAMPVSGAEQWGRPFERKHYGVLGEDLLRIGKDAEPALATLLNNTEELYFGGSDKNWERPNSYDLRVMDFAAFYICKIQRWHYHCFHSARLRNCRIRSLKEN